MWGICTTLNARTHNGAHSLVKACFNVQRLYLRKRVVPSKVTGRHTACNSDLSHNGEESMLYKVLQQQFLQWKLNATCNCSNHPQGARRTAATIARLFTSQMRQICLNMEHWWSDTYRPKRSAWRKPVPLLLLHKPNTECVVTIRQVRTWAMSRTSKHYVKTPFHLILLISERLLLFGRFPGFAHFSF